MTDDSTTFAPDSCTLPTAERPLRQVEFDQLFAQVRRADRVSPRRLRLSLSGPDDLAEAVTDLTERESQCCSFFEFAVTTLGPGQVELAIEVPAAYVGVLDAMAARIPDAPPAGIPVAP